MTAQKSNKQMDANLRVGWTESPELEWHSVLKPPFRVTGLPWFEQDKVFRRLPLHPDYAIRTEIDRLANHTAGSQIRFRTDSRSLYVKVVLADKHSMYQMPATGQCGVDCYIGPIGDQKYVYTSRFNPARSDYESLLFESFPHRMRDITLNLPLYQGVKELWAGVIPGSELAEFPGFPDNKKILIYGTSITQGACASRPGMCYPNILSRTFPYEIVNLGFSGNARGEPELASLIAQIQDPALLVLDYEANTPSTESLSESLPAFIRIYRDSHPKTPILVVSRIPYPAEAFDENLANLRMERKAIQQRTVERLKLAGDQNVHFHDGGDLLGSNHQDGTVDSVHPSDLGYSLIAESLKPAISKLLPR